jgi:hypothetical protein
MPDNGKLTIKDVETAIGHVQSEKNGVVTVTVQDGVILEIKHEAKIRRNKNVAT